jgi:hypothetical protein
MAFAIPPSTTVPLQGTAYGQNAMLFTATPEQVAAQKQASFQEAQSQPVVLGLAAHIRTCWEAAKSYKSSVQQDLVDNLRRRNGEYSADKLAAIKAQGGSTIYMQLTQIKCRTAKAWIRDILMGSSGDKPWMLEPTPQPEKPEGLPEHIEQMVQQRVQQEAVMAQEMGVQVDGFMLEQRAQEYRDDIEFRVAEIIKKKVQRMETKIADQLEEGGFKGAFLNFIDNLVTFRSAFMKGPVIRRRQTLKWVQTPEGWTADSTTKLQTEFYAPSPFDIYTSPDTDSLQDGYLIERHRLTRQDLQAMKGVEGYSDAAIDKVLEDYGRGGLKEWLVLDNERKIVETKNASGEQRTDTIDALQFWGSVQGKSLIEWGMDSAQVPDPLAEYNVEAWLIGGYVIRTILNDDLLGERPYYGTSFDKRSGSVWGNALPAIMADIQDMCNAAARALQNNMGIASGPMVGRNVNRLPEGETLTTLVPWQVLQFTDHKAGISEPPIQFFQPNSNADELLRIFDHFARQADEYTGIPAYAHGDPTVGGAGNTASGLSMLMSAATRGVKDVLANIDADILEPLIKRMYHHNMLYEEDETIKGDLKIVARGSSGLFVREQMQVRRNEFLQVTNNPTDIAIIGNAGRAELLRGAVKALELPVDKIVPSEAKVQEQQMMAEQQQMMAAQQVDPAGNPAGGQANQFQQGAA